MRTLGSVLTAVSLWLAASCSQLPPKAEFPDLGPTEAKRVLATLAERTNSIRTLYAEITAVYRGADLDGTIDLVVHYRAPDAIRITAFKDVVLTVENLFDLVLTSTGHRVAIVEEEGRAPTVTRGTSGFAERFPDFAEFYWAREAFCCPGSLHGEDARVGGDGAGTVLIDGELSSGAAVTWRADEGTLRITSGSVRTPDGRTVELRYSDWRSIDDRFVPGRVEFSTASPTGAKHIDARLDWVEVDIEIDPSIFDLDAP